MEYYKSLPKAIYKHHKDAKQKHSRLLLLHLFELQNESKYFNVFQLKNGQ